MHNLYVYHIFHTIGGNFESKSRLIHLISKFGGLSGVPNKHLLEFHVICMRIKPRSVTDEEIFFKAFSFSLTNKVKDWFY